MKKIYVVEGIHQSDNGVFYGNTLKEVNTCITDAVEFAKRHIEDSGDDGYIYNKVEDKIHSYDAEDGTWVADHITITEELLAGADEDCSLYITDDCAIIMPPLK